MRYLSAFLSFAALAAGFSCCAIGQEAAPVEVSYAKQIRPIFQEHCQGCHQPAKAEGGYVMTKVDALLKGGESGEAAVVAGDAAKGYLLAQITPKEGAAEMPKGKPPLAAEQIELIKTWIAQGAKDDSPASEKLMFDAEHPPTYIGLPMITAIDYSPDGALIAVSGYHEVLLHAGDGSKLVSRLVGQSERIEAVKFSPDGKLLAVAGGSPARLGELQVWDVAEKKLKYSLNVGYDTLYGANFSPDGKLISFGCPDNTVRAVEAETGKQVLFSGAHNDWVRDTVFSSKGDHLISVSRDRSMKLLEVATQRFVDNITSITPGALKGGLESVDRHPAKDELLCGGADGTPKIYQMIRTKARVIGDDFNLIRAFPTMMGRINTVAFDKTGDRIIAGSSLDGKGEVRIFKTADAQQLVKVELPEGGVFAAAFSPAGDVAAVGGFDGMIRLLSTSDGKLVKVFAPVEVSAANAQK
jgi:WD40 repeat protein/mono/diheme cytochrome c family protein